MYLYPLARVEKTVPYDKDNCIFFIAGPVAGIGKCVFSTDEPCPEAGKYQCGKGAHKN